MKFVTIVIPYAVRGHVRILIMLGTILTIAYGFRELPPRRWAEGYTSFKFLVTLSPTIVGLTFFKYIQVSDMRHILSLDPRVTQAEVGYPTDTPPTKQRSLKQLEKMEYSNLPHAIVESRARE